MTVKSKVLIPLLAAGGIFAVVGSQFQDLSPTEKTRKGPDERTAQLSAFSRYRPAVGYYSFGGPEVVFNFNGPIWTQSEKVPVGTKISIRLTPNSQRQIVEIGCGATQLGRSTGDHKTLEVTDISCTWIVR